VGFMASEIHKHGSGSQGFGPRFLEAFRHTGWNQREIARRLGVSAQTVSAYVGGRIPPFETLLAIKRLTGFPLDWLAGDEAEVVVALPVDLYEAIRQIGDERGRTVDEQVAYFLRAGVVLAEDDALDAVALSRVRFELIEAPRRRARASRRRKAGGSK